MEKSETFHLGYVAKLHGFKGEVSLFLDVTDPSIYRNLEMIYIDVNEQLIPHFIQSIKLKNKGFAAVKFEGVDTEEQAKKILRKSIHLPAERLPELKGNEFYDHEVVGFTVTDEKCGHVGELLAVIDHAVNPLLQIMRDGIEILVPLSKQTVKKVDRLNKTLHILAPDGLIDLYLGKS
jgi:16S rRNA processing protein RimM